MPFSVWDTAAIVLKTLTYAGSFGAAGAVFFLGYGGALIASAQRTQVRRMVPILALLSVLAAAAHIMVSAGSMSGAASGMWDESLLRMVWQAGAGRAEAVRAIGLLLAAIIALSDRPAWLTWLGAALAATSFAWTGHALSLRPNALPVLLLVIHLLGVAFWLGALIPLLLVAREDDLARTAAAAARFGAAAVYVVGALLTAGATLLWLMLGSLAALWDSAYGRFVMLKLACVACLLGLAAFNKLRLTPRLRGGDSGAARSLCASIRLELLAGMLILTVTAAFTTLTGPPALD